MAEHGPNHPAPIQEDMVPTVPTENEASDTSQEPYLKPLAAGDPYKHAAPHEDEEQGSEAWTTFVSVGREYDQNMCDVWKAEIDNLLLFASLFSAVATSFVIEAYKLLQVDHQEMASAVLLGIHNQLDNIVRQNTTAPTLTPDPTLQFTPTNSAVAINICFFLSLTLSLSTVSVGVLCLQWIREYRREPEVPLQQMIAIRYFRLRGIENWGVRDFVGLLPVALQLALFIFFIGLAIFLWITNQTVAIVVCCAIGITILIHGATSIISAFRAFFHILVKRYDPDGDHSVCPYRSPQAWFARRFFLGVGMSITYLLENIGQWFPHSTRPRIGLAALYSTSGTGIGIILPRTSRWGSVTRQLETRFASKDWLADDVRHVTSLQDGALSRTAVAWGLASVPRTHRHNVRALCAMIRCIDDMEPDQWVKVLERMDAERSSELVRMLRNIPDSQSKDAPNRVMAQCLTLAHILDFVAENDDKFRLLTLNYRFELYLRTLNQYVDAFELVVPTGIPDRKARDPSIEARWWGFIQTRGIAFSRVYRLGTTRTRELISEDLKIETFKTTCRYIECAPSAFVEYILLSSPLAKCCFHSLPEAVIKFSDVVNARLKHCIDSIPPTSSTRQNMVSRNIILYALRMSERGTEHSQPFISLVRAIPKISIPILEDSPDSEEAQFGDKWDGLVKNLGPPEAEAVRGEGN